jgi:hypothetical protein
VPALEILAAALLVLASVVVFRLIIESDRLLDDASPLDAHEPEPEEAQPFRQAA